MSTMKLDIAVVSSATRLIDALNNGAQEHVADWEASNLIRTLNDFKPDPTCGVRGRTGSAFLLALLIKALAGAA